MKSILRGSIIGILLGFHSNMVAQDFPSRSAIKVGGGYIDMPSVSISDSGIGFMTQFIHRANIFTPFRSLQFASAQPSMKGTFRMLSVESSTKKDIKVSSLHTGLHFNFFHGIYAMSHLVYSSYNEVLDENAGNHNIQTSSDYSGFGFDFGVGYEHRFHWTNRIQGAVFLELTITNERLSPEVDTGGAQLMAGMSFLY